MGQDSIPRQFHELWRFCTSTTTMPMGLSPPPIRAGSSPRTIRTQQPGQVHYSDGVASSAVPPASRASRGRCDRRAGRIGSRRTATISHQGLSEPGVPGEGWVWHHARTEQAGGKAGWMHLIRDSEHWGDWLFFHPADSAHPQGFGRFAQWGGEKAPIFLAQNNGIY